MKERPGFMLYFDLVDALNSLDDVQAGQLFKALMAYAQWGEVRPLTGVADFAFRTARPRIDKDAERYADRCRKNLYYSYLRSAKQRGEPLLEYEEWEEMICGSPTQPNTTQPNTTTTATANTTAAATAAAGRAAAPPPVEHGGFSFSPRMQKAIGDWLQYKRERRETYTDTGLQSLFQQLQGNIDRWGEEAVAQLMGECMAAGYRGIVFDRLAKRGKTPAMPEPESESLEWMKPYLEGRKKK